MCASRVVLGHGRTLELGGRDRRRRTHHPPAVPRRDGSDRFEADTPGDGPGRLFGGQVAAQSLRAATLTVDATRPPHSFHAYFVRPGRPGIPLVLDVIRIRDGRSFTTRAVTASQGGEAIFFLAASFHSAEDGDDWQLPARDDIPGPDEVDHRSRRWPSFESMMPFEMRPAAGRSPMGLALHPFWVRVGGPCRTTPRCTRVVWRSSPTWASSAAPARHRRHPRVHGRQP